MKNWIVVAALFVAVPAWGQTPPSLEAHRLYFVAVSSWIDKDPDTAAKAIRSYLNTASVAESEHAAAFKVLAKFKNNYAAYTKAYNETPATRAGTNEDTDSFVSIRDAITREAIEELRFSLSAENFAHLTEQVRRDSLNIRNVGMEPVAKHRHGTKLVPVLGNMNGHYSASRSSSAWTDANGKYYYYETPVVDGYTSCSSPCSSVTHQGVVINTLGGGQPVYGPHVTPTSNISVSNQQMFTFGPNCFDPNDPTFPCYSTNFNEESSIQCSVFGTFFGWGSFQFVLEAAVTFSQVVSTTNGAAFLRDWCLPQYEPPDYNPGVLLNAQPGATYVLGGAGCINSTWNSGFWLCTPGIATSMTGTYTRKYCTHNHPPY